MSNNDSATVPSTAVLSASRAGLGWGLLGVGAFSLTVPLTRIVVADGGMSALFVGAGRAVIAALIAGLALWATGQRPPRGGQWLRVGVVAAGVVAGFPVLTSFALTTASASHSAVVIALLPAATAVLAALRARERQPATFWVLAALGAVAAVVFALLHGGSIGGLSWSDLLLLGAVLAAGVGYAEGGLLARELGAWQTISWALVLAAPLMLLLAGISAVRQPPSGTLVDWAAFGYLAVVSAYLGFFAWYRGLALGPIARVSQIQLVQPVLSICFAALLLGERITLPTVLGGLAVIGCAGLAVRVRMRPALTPPAR